MKLCTVPGCGRPHKARGFCERHYVSWWATSDFRRAEPRINHRYCTCTGTITRTPGLRDQCDHCLRRIHPRFDSVPGDELVGVCDCDNPDGLGLEGQ